MTTITNYQRLSITIPDGMATQIDKACKIEGRNRSEFFREAVRHYMGTHNGERSPSFIVPAGEAVRAASPFHAFNGVEIKRPSMYGGIDMSAKDAELAKWAALVESDPVFADVRAVSSDVNAIAGEAVV